MTGHDFGQLAYLLLLLVAIGGYFLASGRQSMGRTAQQGAIWGLIFVGAIAVAGLWNDMSQSVAPQQQYIGDTGRVEVPVARDGHYYLTLTINGVAVDFVVDTGATDLVLARDDAKRVGIDPDRLAYVGRALTANGAVHTAGATLKTVELGPIMDRGVPASVSGGDMPGSLLGMSYLNRFQKIEITNNTLTLER